MMKMDRSEQENRGGRKLRPQNILIIIVLILILIGMAVSAWLFFFRRPPGPDVPPMPDLPQVEPPTGAQLFLLPIQDGAVTSGYLNAQYLVDQGYPHYGIDIWADGITDILASGDGVVLGTDDCPNSVGKIAVIQYDNVFIPQTGEAISLVARYYHMFSSHVSKGDAVVSGQVIGAIDGAHKWYNHIHLELDTDLTYPFHTPQVAEASSELLHRYPANGESIIEPLTALVVGAGQRVYIHPGAKWCGEGDLPRFSEKLA